MATRGRLPIDYEKLYQGGKKQEPKAPKAELPPVDKTLPLVEQAHACTQFMFDNAVRLAGDTTQPGTVQLQANIFIKELAYGKATSDAPRMADKKDKADVASKVLALLTDTQLEELRATGVVDE